VVNPLIESTSGLLAPERLSITLKLGPQLAIEHIRFASRTGWAENLSVIIVGPQPNPFTFRMKRDVEFRNARASLILARESLKSHVVSQLQ
jgi:hypothetical protein